MTTQKFNLKVNGILIERFYGASICFTDNQKRAGVYTQKAATKQIENKNLKNVELIAI